LEPNKLTAIPTVTPADPEAQSAHLVAANFQALRALFPGAFAEDKVDFDVLRQLLGDVVDDGDEKYGLNWSGKRQARRLALTPSLGTLRPAPVDSLDWEAARNLMIEGDNLEVLKILQKSYAGKVKLIYIDPPYNTGGDFVYPDDYRDNIGNYLLRTGQLDSEGVRSTSNPESGGRYHTNWLNMLYPRLMLARGLLTDDGVIAVSINDVEVADLRLIMDAIFGEENFITSLVWKSRQNKDNRTTNGVSVDHEYIVCYGVAFRGEDRKEGSYTNPDNDPRGPWASANMVGLATIDRRPNLHYDLVDPDTGVKYECPPLGWRYDRSTMARLIRENAILWPSSPSGRPRRKAFLADIGSEFTGFSSIVGGEIYTRHGTADVQELFEERVFEFPKPVKLVRELLTQTTSAEDIILDFFAGSGTTGHAVMAQNAADDGKRRYILVQLPEPLDQENRDQKTASEFCVSLGKPRNIAELTKERLRRAAAKVRSEHPETGADLGFRVYKLDTSNLKTWAATADLEADLLAAADNLVEGRTEDDLLVELLLKQGIDLTEPVVTKSVIGRTVHAFGGGVLAVCLGDVTVTDAEPLADAISDWIAALAPVAPTTVFFKDAGFANDQAKTNVAAVLEQRLGDQLLKVRSL
jgi:adenine-specific DNA-methyltransferase